MVIPEEEYNRLIQAIETVMAIPFIADVEAFVWEAIVHYVKDLSIPDAVQRGRKKLLFDVVHPNGTGWSCKTLQWSLESPTCEFVIARADVFKKSVDLIGEQLDRDSPVEEIGFALLELWRNKVTGDMQTQRVIDPQLSLLLKQKGRPGKYALLETPLVVPNAEDMEWVWTDETKTGLQGHENEELKFRWYPNQTQLFEVFPIDEAVRFDISIMRLPVNEVVDAIQDRLRHHRLL